MVLMTQIQFQILLSLSRNFYIQVNVQWIRKVFRQYQLNLNLPSPQIETKIKRDFIYSEHEISPAKSHYNCSEELQTLYMQHRKI